MYTSDMRAFAFILLLLTSARADVTIRYQATVTPSPIMPPEAQAQVKQTAGAPVTMLVKGSKGYTQMKDVITVTDLAKQTTTFINNAQKTYATVSMNDYDKVIAQMLPNISPETRSMLDNMETKFESKDTGRKQTIQGIVAEDYQVTITISAKTATDQEKSGVMMRMVLDIWSADPNEAARVPALSEVERFTALSQTAMNPTAMVQQMLGPYSAMSKEYEALAKGLLRRKSLVLRTHVSLYVPSLAQAASALAGAGRQVPAFDPNGPLIELNQEVVELSTAPVNPSVFEVPASYKESTAAEIMKTRLEK